MSLKHCNIHSIRLKNTVLHDEEPIVQNGLAVTPSQMLEMTNHGIPITPQNLGLTYDEGVSKLDFEPPMEFKRGVDICDMWEHRENMKSKVRSKEFQALLTGKEVIQ